MAEKQKPGQSPSERGRNYTPLREVVHCALPGASPLLRRPEQQMISCSELNQGCEKSISCSGFLSGCIHRPDVYAATNPV